MIPAGASEPWANSPLAAARRVLIDHRVGVALADERPIPARFVPEPATGDLLLRLPRGALDAQQIVLHTPDESDDSLQALLGVLGAGDERGAPAAPEITAVGVDEALIDRWRIVHGDPPASPARRDVKPETQVFVRCAIETGRHGGAVFDGESLAIRNPLAREEPEFCRRLNADRAALDRVALARTGVRTEGAVCVTLDPWGLLVRTPLGVRRVPFARTARNADEARALIEELIASGAHP